MALTFDKTIDLTQYAGNPAPKVVTQLGIVHEAYNGDITQYYIDSASLSEGDKESHALGIRVQDADNSAHYEYTDYDLLQWSMPGARITRRRIDRLGVKAFPNVGAIAHYKLANQNISKIVAPVNYRKEKVKAPTLSAVVNSDDTVTFTITSSIKYQCYRITMQLDLNRLEYVTYDLTFTVPKVPATGTYICWATGYLNEGAISSVDSNELQLSLTGSSSSWPAVMPGTETPQRLSELFDVTIGELTTNALLMYNSQDAKWSNITIDELTANQKLSELQDTDIHDALHHQLLRFNAQSAKWENYTSAVEGAGESAAHIVEVYMRTGKIFTVKVDNYFANSISISLIEVTLNDTALTVINVEIVDNTTINVEVAESITGAFSVTVLKDAFMVPQNDAGPYICDDIILSVEDYAGKMVSNMTSVAVNSDEGTATFTIPSDFTWNYRGARLAYIIISGNSYMGLGSNSEHVRFNRRDTYINVYRWQLYSAPENMLRIRWEGWSPYSSLDNAHRYAWELFLFSDGNACIFFDSKGAYTTWDGTFVFNGKSYSISESNKFASFTRVSPSAAGTEAADWDLTYEPYKIRLE